MRGDARNYLGRVSDGENKLRMVREMNEAERHIGEKVEGMGMRSCQGLEGVLFVLDIGRSILEGWNLK